jgi:hypothetical protein
VSEVILKFPSTNHIADFLATKGLYKVEVDLSKLIVRGYLTEDELITASHEYQAKLLEKAGLF